MKIEEYIIQVPEKRKDFFIKIRDYLNKKEHNLQEGFEYKMPTYSLDGTPIFAMASQKQYFSFYVMPYGYLKDISEIINKYNPGKSCIRFRQFDKEQFDDIVMIINHILDKVKAKL